MKNLKLPVPSRHAFAALLVAATLPLSAVAQDTLSISQGPAGETVQNPPRSGDEPSGSTEITQSASNAITPLNSVSCNSAGGSAANQYLRRFQLDADHGISSPFGVSSVDFGMESITAGGPGACAGNPVDLNVYSIPSGAPFTYANLTLVETASVDLAGTVAPTIVNIPLPGAGAVDGSTDDLVIEMTTCDHSSLADGGFEFVGSNSGGQLRPSYLASAACGITEPTDTAAIGFPEMQIVMTVYGEAEAVDQARFLVSKDFNDNNEAEVEVTLSCNTGLPLEQTIGISEGSPVNFVIGDFAQGELDCEVTEEVPVGYEASYNNGDTESSVSCSWVDLTGGQYACAIDNDLLPSEVTVTKEWIDENPGFDAQNIAEAYWSCSNAAFCIGSVGVNGGGCASGYLDFYGNPDDDSFLVYPDWEDGTTCDVVETYVFDGGVEIDDSDCQDIVLFPGDSAECTIVNTRLYEGIPTLSQYGLGLLALMMLGMGFVAVRRFV